MGLFLFQIGFCLDRSLSLVLMPVFSVFLEQKGLVYLFIFKASVEAFSLASCLLVIRGVGRRLVSHELTVDKCSLPLTGGSRRAQSPVFQG